jgi:hypothetical protein
MKDFTLSDGTVLPAGTEICLASGPMNTDEVCIAFNHIIDDLNDESLLSGLFQIRRLSRASGLLTCVMVTVN